ncbi:MAG: MFS transporter [Clostridia bacterium]|nr:MFS transporter [Clostridia bacterium]
MKRLIGWMRKNPMVDILFTARGNELPCMLTEPLWGIPYNLYVPFASMYMVALGVGPLQIGVTQTVFLLSQVIFAILSGVLTDKLGRRWCTLIFDTLSWSVPALLWACAQSYEWFLVAAVFNGAWRVTENSWYLLFIEDSAEDRLVRLFSVTHIAGLIAGFISPLAFGFVQRYGLVPTMRVLYAITFVMMTAKFVILHIYCKETRIGLRRKQECRHVSILRHLWDSRRVFVDMLRNKRIMMAIGLIACYMTMRNTLETFWPLLVTERLQIPEENLSIFATIKSLIMLASYFVIVPHVNADKFKHPMLLALGLMIAQHVITMLLPPGAYALVVVGAVMEAVALSLLSPLTTTLQTMAIPPEERARMQGFFFTICLFVTSPFGMIAGALSDLNRVLPMVLSLALLGGCILFTLLLHRDTIKIDQAAAAA